MLGLATGNPTADKILAALERAAEGLDRTDVSGLFGNNKSASEISAALAYLQDRGRIERRSVQLAQGKPGRPSERWYCTKETKKTKKPPDTMPVMGINAFSSFNSSAPRAPGAAPGRLVGRHADRAVDRIAAQSSGGPAPISSACSALPSPTQRAATLSWTGRSPMSGSEPWRKRGGDPDGRAARLPRAGSRLARTGGGVPPARRHRIVPDRHCAGRRARVRAPGGSRTCAHHRRSCQRERALA